jgi:hypothetical protein
VADLCAAGTGIGAAPHLLALEARAIFRAEFADFGAGVTGQQMQVRATDHKVSGGLTDLHTVEHQSGMTLFDMRAAHLEAVLGKRLQTDAMTVEAGIDALLHGWIHGDLLSFVLTQRKFRPEDADDAHPTVLNAQGTESPEPYGTRYWEDG